MSARIDRIRRRYQTGEAHVSIERARLYTNSWRATEGQGLPQGVRVALAMRNVYAGMTHYLDPDDRIAGTWTERFLGVPIDIERGVFNEVLANELTRPRMLRARARTAAAAAGYLARRGGLRQLVRGQRQARRHGGAPLSMKLEPMPSRRVNPFQIAASDRRELTRVLLPYWRGQTLVDRLDTALASSGLRSGQMHDFVLSVAGGTSRQVAMISTCATVATLQGHVILDHQRVLTLGLDGMRAEVRARRAAAVPGSDADDFLHALELSLEGVTLFADRLLARVEAELALATEPERREVLTTLRDRCARVPRRPPATFAEAVQALWTVKTAVELAHPVNLHCFGRLDQILYPYYAADLASGRTTEAEAQELLEELLLKLMAQNLRPESNLLANFYHRFLGSTPVTVGGLTPDGADGTTPLTYLFVEAAAASRAVTNVSVRIHRHTPDALLEAVGRHIAAGASNLSLYNDEVMTTAMERRGFAPDHARDYALMGCVEATCPGRTGAMSANALLLTRLLDLTLRDGDSAMLSGTLPGEAPPRGPEALATFEGLVDSFIDRAGWFIDRIVAASNLRDRLYAEHLPAPFISAFMDGCLDSGRDVTAGGARYDLSGISLINAIANLVDALHVIRALVYEQRVCTLGELLAAVDADYEGHEALLARIQDVPGRWGNGDPEVDALAREVTLRLVDQVTRHRAARGGPFVPYVISMITHTIDGRLSIASPDGRRAATPFAASCNPANVEQAGVTAALRSVAALPFEDILGAAVNLKLHPTAVGATPEARVKWAALVRAYFAMGGAQLQPTGVSAETLRAARRDPAAHRDLIVKVGGYSSYFVDLGRDVQDEIISRTEHGAPA